MNYSIIKNSIFFFIFLGFCLLLPGKAYAATDVSGIISQDTTWDKAGSPYIVRGNVLVDSGVTLAVNEGVDIQFDGYYYLQIKGRLNAKGTSEEPIKIHTTNITNGKGIQLKSNNNQLEFCEIYDCEKGIQLISNFNSNTSFNNEIKNCKISKCWTGLESQLGNFRITDSYFMENYYGIYIDNICYDNSVISCNIFDNDIGIFVNSSNNYYGSPNISISESNFYKNDIYNIKTYLNSRTINAINNYWGKSDKTGIENDMYDYYDDFDLGKILFEPYSLQPFGNAIVLVTGISLNKDNIEINSGEIETLNAILTPSNATNNNVIWSSNNPLVATVNANGEVTAINEGTTTINATTEDGNKTAQCVVIVKPIYAESISMNKSTLFLNIETTEVLTATIHPSNATNKNITWKSSNESIASVDNTGKITAIGEGTAIITATSEDGNKTAQCEVTVRIKPSTLPQNPVEFQEKTCDDKNKMWTIRFNSSLDEGSVNNDNIMVLDSSGYKQSISLAIGTDKKSVKVSAPDNGYGAGKTYTLYVLDRVTSGGKNLKQAIKMEFFVDVFEVSPIE